MDNSFFSVVSDKSAVGRTSGRPALLAPFLAALMLFSWQGGLLAGDGSKPFPVQFRDVTGQAGLSFEHNNGAFGKKYLPETMGSGVAFLDYDNDDWQDILLINGKDWPGRKGRRSTMALYRNDRDGTFTDVTRKVGLDIELYGMGCAAGDYDNDGWVDLYVSALGPDRLFRNKGGNTFEDVTRKSGLDNPQFATSVAWLDYDRDGNLDLLVTNYVKWSIETDLHCSLDGVNKSYCTPESYPGVSSRLFRNQGDGAFADVTRKAGLLDSTSKALGWPSSTPRTTAGPTCCWPTTPSPTSSTSTGKTAPSGMRGSRPGWPSARTGPFGEPWGWTRPTTTGRDWPAW